MSIPSDIKVPQILTTREPASLVQKNAREATRGEDAFDGLLKRALSLNNRKSGVPQTSAPMEKKDAENLLRQMQARLNTHHWHTLVDEGADTVPVRGSSLSMLSPLFQEKLKPADAETEVSKLRQAMRKNAGGPTRKDIDRVVALAARTYDVNPDLIRRVIRTESNFNHGSRSPKGAMGLMQLMPETARELGVADPYDPIDNVMAGTRYLKGLIDRYRGDVPRALAAYNWGMGNVERNPDGLPAETRRYVARITQAKWKA